LLLGYENLKNAANDCPLWITAEIVRPSTISQMGPRMIMMQIYEWLGVPLLVLLLWFGLRDAAQRRVQTGVTRGLVALMFAGPHLGTIYAGLQTLLSRSEPWQHDLGRGYLQAAYYFGATLTAMPGAWLQVVTGYDKLDGLKWLSAMQPMGLVWEVLIWAGMLLFWWRLGLKTLHDVRSNA